MPDTEPSSEPPAEVTRELFLRWRAPREGTANPESMTNPVWTWLVRSGLSAWEANDLLKGPESMKAGPCWCCDRLSRLEGVRYEAVRR